MFWIQTNPKQSVHINNINKSSNMQVACMFHDSCYQQSSSFADPKKMVQMVETGVAC